MVMDTLVQVGESKANVASALHCVTQCNTVHRNESNYLLNNFISDVRILWNTLTIFSGKGVSEQLAELLGL